MSMNEVHTISPGIFPHPKASKTTKENWRTLKGRKNAQKRSCFWYYYDLPQSSAILTAIRKCSKIFTCMPLNVLSELLQNWWKSIKKVFVSTCMLSILNVVLVHAFWKVKWCAVPLILFHWLFYRFSGQFSCMFLNNSQHQQNNVLFCTSQCNYISEWSACSQHVVGYFGPHIPLASYLPDNR